MFGAKTRLKMYLNQIAPYALGLNGRGWYPSDFLNSDMRTVRCDPTHIIFNIPEPLLPGLDILFINKNQYRAFVNLRQAISNYNSSLAVVNASRRDLQDTYYNLITILHTFCIGSLGSGGLFDAFNNLYKELS